MGNETQPHVLCRIPSLDGLRAISIALVILYHICGNGFAGIFSNVGNLGVRVFFVISGFLITGLLLREIESTGSINFKNFYLKRSFRIFPAFYVFLFVVFICSTTGFIELRRHDLAEAATYTINYFVGQGQSVYVRHIWSLSVEEQFYLLWPVVLFCCGKRRGLSVAGSYIAIAPIIRIFYWYFVPGFRDLLDRRFETVADAIAVGCVLAGTQTWLANSPRYNKLIRSKWFYVLPIILYLDANFLPNHPRSYLSIGQTALNIGIACCIDRWVRFPDGIAGAVLNAPAVRRVGLWSYSIYLWQQPFVSPESRAYVAFPLNLILTLVFSLSSFYFVEIPLQQLRRKIERTKRTAAAS